MVFSLLNVNCCPVGRPKNLYFFVFFSSCSICRLLFVAVYAFKNGILLSVTIQGSSMTLVVECQFWVPYERHHNPLLITNHSWILTINKGRIFWKKIFDKSFFTFKKWVKYTIMVLLIMEFQDQEYKFKGSFTGKRFFLLWMLAPSWFAFVEKMW